MPSSEDVKAWLLPSGAVLCVDQAFVDYLGYTPQDMVGKALGTIAADPGELER